MTPWYDRILQLTEQKEDKMQEVVIAPQEYNPNALVKIGRAHV